MMRAEENLAVRLGLYDETLLNLFIYQWRLCGALEIEISSAHASKCQPQYAYGHRKIPAICIVTQCQPNSYLTVI